MRGGACPPKIISAQKIATLAPRPPAPLLAGKTLYQKGLISSLTWSLPWTRQVVCRAVWRSARRGLRATVLGDCADSGRTGLLIA